MTTHTPSEGYASHAGSPSITGDVVYAGFWRQIVAFALDSWAIGILSTFGAYQVFLIATIVPLSTQAKPESVLHALLAASLAASLFTVAYNALFDASAMQGTPGKRMLGIKVVDESGTRIGLPKALMRAILQTPPWPIGYLLIPFDRRKRGLQDMIAGTLVVDRWAWSAFPGRQSSTTNRIAAWVGICVTLNVALLYVILQVDIWREAGSSSPWWETISAAMGKLEKPRGRIIDGSNIVIVPEDPPVVAPVVTLAIAPVSDAVLAPKSDAHGMTWGVGPTPKPAGVALVSCHGQPYATTKTGSCDAYVGDTACATVLPVLCLRQDGRPAPDESLRNTWAKGEIALAPAVAGSVFHSQADADAYCSKQRGPGWRIAEHHDGHGWLFRAAGTIAGGSRFWVANNDMPANCWNSKPRARTDTQFKPGSIDAPQLVARDVVVSGIVRSFNAGCYVDGVCSIEVGNRTIYLPSPHRGVQPAVPVVYGQVDRLPNGQEWVGQRVEIFCNLLRGSCSIEGRADYYIRLIP